MSLENFMIVGGIIFAIGLYGALTKRNAITVLMCIEIMFNAVIINVVAVSRYVLPAHLVQNPAATSDEVLRLLLTGQIFAVFIVTVAAAEIVLGVAIIISIYRNRETMYVTDVTQMRN